MTQSLHSCSPCLHSCAPVHNNSASNRQLSSWIIRTIVVQTREICCDKWSANNEKTMSGRGGPSYSYAALPQSETCSCAAKRTFNSEDARFVSNYSSPIFGSIRVKLSVPLDRVSCLVPCSTFSVPVLIECLEIGPFSSQSSLNGPLPEIFPFSASKCFNQYALKCKLDYGKQAVRWEEKLRG